MNPRVQKIVRATERHFKLPPHSILRSTRGSALISHARHVAMYLRYVQLYGSGVSQVNWSQIGREFSRDRSCVRVGVHRIGSKVEAGILDLSELHRAAEV